MELLDITPNKARDFIEGSTLYATKNLLTPTHIREQAIWRAFLCDECLNKGSCKICGCSTPAMFFSPNKVDSDKKWGVMLSKSKWKEFKENDEYYNKAIKTDKYTKIADRILSKKE